MNRSPEYGVCRLVQEYVRSHLRTFDPVVQSGALVLSQDEGDWVTRMERSIQADRIVVFISTGALSRGPQGFWSVGVEIAVTENVILNRGETESSAVWTSLRLAEAILATLHERQMPDGPRAWLQAADQALTLDSETPAVLYTVKVNARLGPVLKF